MSPVIAAEFLTQLQKVHQSFNWNLTADQAWPEERRAQPRQLLRGKCTQAGAPDALFDPIGAVCFILTGKVFDAESWIDAAGAIELTPIDAGDLTAAANDRTWNKTAGAEREPDSYLQSLRGRLLDAVGLDTA